MSISLKLPLDVIKVIDGFCYNCKRKRRCIKTPFFIETNSEKVCYLKKNDMDMANIFKSKCFECSSFNKQGIYKKISLLDQFNFDNFDSMICDICNMNARGLIHLNNLRERDFKLKERVSGLKKYSKSLNDIVDEIEIEKKMIKYLNILSNDSENEYEDDDIDLGEYESRLSTKNSHASKILKLKNFLYHDDFENMTLCRLCFTNQLIKYENNMFHFFMAISLIDTKSIDILFDSNYERFIRILSGLKIIELKFKILKFIYPCCIRYKEKHQDLWKKFINKHTILNIE